MKLCFLSRRYLSLLIVAFAFFVHSGFTQENADDDEVEFELTTNKIQNHLQAPPNSEVYPLTILEGEKLKSLTIMDREVLSLACTLKNISEKKVRIVDVQSSCPCLAIDEVKDAVLGPQKCLELKMSLDARRLSFKQDGSFEKKFFVHIENVPVSFAVVSGQMKEMISYDPAAIIDLGNFIGDVPQWKRTVTMTTLFEEENIDLKLIKGNRFFNLAVTKQAPKVFKLEITPKDPFHVGMIQESIPLNVEGIPNYGPIAVLVLGHSQGLAFRLKQNTKIFKRNEVNTSENQEFDVPIDLLTLHMEPKQSRLMRKLVSNNTEMAHLPVSKEENAIRPMDNVATWSKYATGFSMPEPPAGVSVQFVPEDNGVKIHFTVSPDFWKQEKNRFESRVFYKRRPFGNFTLVIK